MSFENELTAKPPRAPKKEKEVFTYDFGLLYIILPHWKIQIYLH